MSNYPYFMPPNVAPMNGQFQQQMEMQNNNFQPMLPRQEILRINGMNGVNALRMAPNSSVLALDSEQPILWLIQTDGAGYKTPTPYQIVKIEEKPAIDNNNNYQMLEQRIANLEAIISGQSDIGTTGQESRNKSTRTNGNAKQQSQQS